MAFLAVGSRLTMIQAGGDDSQADGQAGEAATSTEAAPSPRRLRMRHLLLLTRVTRVSAVFWMAWVESLAAPWEEG